MKNSFKPDEDDNKERIDKNETGADFLPIHCIIQTVTCVEDIKTAKCKDCDEKNRTNAKNWWECDCKNIEMSGCVVVPEDTSINDFVKTVLVKLGYPSASSSFASGSILIRNWKPLPLKTICPGMNKSVGDILGELTTLVSLRIQIFRPKITILENIKDNLLNFLIKANQHFLIDSGCPFDVSTLLKLCTSSDYVTKQFAQQPSEEIKKKIDTWLKLQEETEREFDKTEKNQQSQSNSYLINNSLNKITSKNNSNSSSNGLIEQINQPANVPSLEISEKRLKEPEKGENYENLKESSLSSIMERPKFSTVPKTRIRTSFDPELELPKLHKWYIENPHPTRQQIYEYVSELNSLESRKGRKQLDINNVLYWFKNARAAQKRTESRRLSNTSGTNGTIKSSNVLKIPLGKTSAIGSDDQRSISDDEVSITSESAEDYRNRNDRCLQVVGKWNSNGQGEAVLEMQIGSHKSTFGQANKKEEMSENEETSRSALLSTDEDSIDPTQRLSPSDKNVGFTQPSEIVIKGSQDLNPGNENHSEVGFSNKEVKGSNEKYKNEDLKKDDITVSKVQLLNRFPSYKEENIGSDVNFLPPYKTGFTTTSNCFEHSLMCMSQYMNTKLNNLPLSADEKRKRNRTFIDPVTEVPRLEKWFRLSTHPSHNLIARYTDELNSMPYRRKFPKLETKNVQFWFKNRRAKNKRLNYMEVSK